MKCPALLTSWIRFSAIALTTAAVLATSGVRAESVCGSADSRAVPVPAARGGQPEVPPAATPDTPGPLRAAAEGAGFYWGAAVAPNLLDQADYAGALAAHFTIFTPENHTKFPALQPSRGHYDFIAANRLASFAVAHGLKMRGHVLIWREKLSGRWITEEGKTPEQLRSETLALMQEHIHTTLCHFRTHYPDVFVQWDVVNEAFRADGTLRASDWQRLIGDADGDGDADDFIEKAFEFAHQAWPELALYYNDFFDVVFHAGGQFIEASGQIDSDSPRPGFGAIGPVSDCALVKKCDAVRAMAGKFRREGVPIHGIGFQGHVGGAIGPDYRQLAAPWVEPLGLRWAITELDRPCPRSEPGSEEEKQCFENQAAVFQDVVQACVDSPACNTVVQWGVSDRYSWYNSLSSNQLDRPLALDKAYAYKPAAHAVRSTLDGSYEGNGPLPVTPPAD